MSRLPTQRDWQALFRAAAAEGLDVVEVTAGDVRVTLRLRGAAEEARSYVEEWERKSARAQARRAKAA